MNDIEFVGKVLRARDEQWRITKCSKSREDNYYNLGRLSALDDIINWIKQE